MQEYYLVYTHYACPEDERYEWYETRAMAIMNRAEVEELKRAEELLRNGAEDVLIDMGGLGDNLPKMGSLTVLCATNYAPISKKTYNDLRNPVNDSYYYGDFDYFLLLDSLRKKYPQIITELPKDGILLW